LPDAWQFKLGTTPAEITRAVTNADRLRQEVRRRAKKRVDESASAFIEASEQHEAQKRWGNSKSPIQTNDNGHWAALYGIYASLDPPQARVTKREKP